MNIQFMVYITVNGARVQTSTEMEPDRLRNWLTLHMKTCTCFYGPDDARSARQIATVFASPCELRSYKIMC